MVDVTIRGAGIFGLSIAWACVQRGAKVAVIDPNGAASGSSGGVVGALAPHTPEQWNEKKEFQFLSLMQAQTFWANVDAVSGVSSGYARSGRLQPIPSDHALGLAHQRAQNAKTLWKGQAEWRVVQAGDFAPWAPESATGWLIYDTLTARMHPRQACRSLVAALEQRGVRVQLDGEDQGAVVWATGYQGLEAMTRAHHRLVGVGVKGQSAVLGFDARDKPQLFAEGLHIVPHSDGTVGIGSTTEREFDAPDGVDHQLDDLLARAVQVFPVLKGAPVLDRWAGVRPRARSRAPMLGLHPHKPGHFVANGGFKIGFGMAPRVSDVMADLVLDGIDRIPASFRAETCL